jgi:hypothetical protein
MEPAYAGADCYDLKIVADYQSYLAKSRVKYDSPSAQIIKNHENLPAAGKSAFQIIVPVLKRIVIRNNRRKLEKYYCMTDKKRMVDSSILIDYSPN